MSEATLFEQAIAIESESDRMRFIESAFSGKPREKEQFLKLLAAHEEDDEWIDGPGPLVETELTPPTEINHAIGSRIGPYKLLQQIGQGGFGVVYLAEESQTINRRVALKIIKPGMGSKEVIARFEAERQALAMMEHDNIARVFGGGTTDAGLPYFVMELVKGIPITDYCVQKQFTTEQRIKLFISVCRGVQHAHQKGVIHRDLKPSNILVAEYDHRPVVKIIDFGVAKALNQRLTEQTLFTQYGSLIGTVQYMSPEQAKFNQLDVDTRSDVYSLGAVLYELLTGDTPISKERVRTASFEEIIRWIREEEPGKPSTKVNLPAESMGMSNGVENKRPRLNRLISTDLDWVVMKALEKDRDRRYEASSEFGDDLQRYLNQEPVLASPPSVTYRMSKFLRRHYVAVTSVAAMLALIVLGTGMFVRWQMVSIDNRRIDAEKRTAVLELKELNRKNRERLELEEIENLTIPRIITLVRASEYGLAFDLIQQVKRRLPDHEQLNSLLAKASTRVTIRSEPPGAQVTLWDYSRPEETPRATGLTPATFDLAKSAYRYRIELDGYESVEGFASSDSSTIQRVLDPVGSIPEGMVRVPASAAAGISDDYLIDRFEVTNREFLEFVDNGGYTNKGLWGEFTVDPAELVDQTGQPGPRYWKNGKYRPGTADMPVVGICWAEAAAYAKANQKELPTVQHWNHASGEEHASIVIPTSNLRSTNLIPVGQSNAIGPFGTLDMFGNATEWCFNQYGESSRTVGGNSFNGPEYGLSAGTPEVASARENFIGFRCMRRLGARQTQLYATFKDDRHIPFDGRQPVDDERFAELKAKYNYDNSLFFNTNLESVQEGAMPGIRREIHSFDAAYGERMFAHVFRPASAVPVDPQVVVFFPGAGGFKHNVLSGSESPIIASVVRSGRICVVPIVAGMYQRRKTLIGSGSAPHAIVKQIKDVRRTVDFLQRSDEFKHARFAFMGNSYGARLGPIVCALESRFECAIYFAGGLPRFAKEAHVDTVNFAPRAAQPCMMINGKDDHTFPLEACQKPMFRFLGAPEGLKRHELVDGGHSVQYKDLASRVEPFLDTYLGPTNRQMRTWRESLADLDAQARFAFSRRDHAQARDYVRKQIDLIRENGTADDAELLAETQFRLVILADNDDFESRITVSRQALVDAESSLGKNHPVSARTRNVLAYDLIRSSITKILEEDGVDDSGYLAGKRELVEADQLIPEFAWPQIGFAAAAIREGNDDRARRHLDQCERLPFTWDLEFEMRALLAARSGNLQEARDWLTTSKLEATNHYQERLLPRSDRFLTEYRRLSESSDNETPTSKNTRESQEDSEKALQRLLAKYPEHYYLHWQKGYLAVRRSAMEVAHAAFQAAFELCPGYRTTDWLAITSKWHNDQDTLERSHKRLIELAQMKNGCYIWDGLHLGRVYCLTKSENNYTKAEVAIFKQHVERVGWFSTNTPACSRQWLSYRQGASVRIAAYWHKNNPEEQVESMILDAITEFRFGSRSEAFDKLADAREFVATVLPEPDGRAFKYVDSEHAWCVAQLLLREATALIDLPSVEFDSQVASAVLRLRKDLESKFGKDISEKILLEVGDALVKRYEGAETPDEQ